MEQLLEFTGNNTMLVVLLMVSFFVLIFSELRRKASGMVAVEPTDAVALINNGGGVVLDLRSSEAFARGHIVNARNIPFAELDAHQDRIDDLRNKPVVAVCDSGVNSTKAVATLRNSGFESAYGLKGGMGAWSQAGMPIVTSKKTKSKNKGKK